MARVSLFLLLTTAFSAVFWGLIIATGRTGGGHGAYATGLMWCPGLAALLACRISGVPLSSLGWSWGPWRWQALAYLVPLGYATLAYGLAWGLGLVVFPDPVFVVWARKGLGWTSAPDGIVVSGVFLLVATTGMAVNMAHALGEEIGWRGFLAPALTRKLGFGKGALLTAAIWAAWHMPILFFADYNAGTPWWYGAGCFTLLVAALSVVMSWLRLRSGSLWTGTVFHASHNLFIQSFFTPAVAAAGAGTAYAIDEFGWAVPAMACACATVVWAAEARARNAQL